MSANEVFDAVGNNKLREKGDDELREMIIVCGKHVSGNDHIAQLAKHAIEMIRDEIDRRQLERMKAERQIQHEASLEESRKLRDSVGTLKKPHWSVAPGFWAIVLTMIFAAIAAWPVIREWIPAFEPADKAPNFLPLQSNSAPAQAATPQTSPPAIYATPNTNLPAN